MDAVLLARIAGDDSTLKANEVSADGKRNSDVTHDGKADAQDLAKLMQYLANYISLQDLAQ